MHVFVNGQQVGVSFNPISRSSTRRLVFTYSHGCAHALQSGKNVIANQAVRGGGVYGFNNSRLTIQLTMGKILAVKLIGAARGVDGPSLLISNKEWKASLKADEGWQNAGS